MKKSSLFGFAAAGALLLSPLPALAQSGSAGGNTQGSKQSDTTDTQSRQRDQNRNTGSQSGQGGQSGSQTDQSGSQSGQSGSRSGQSQSGNTAADRADATGTGRMSAQDRQFVTKAAKSGMMEVEMARMGLDRATSPQVKAYAQRLVDDHTKANSELQSIAQAGNVNLPTSMPSENKGMNNKLTNAGQNFDRTFVDMMLREHEKDVQLFERQANNGSDDQLKAFAARTLPTLREHLQQARSLQGNMGGGRGGNTGSGTNNNRNNDGTTGTTPQRPNNQ